MLQLFLSNDFENHSSQPFLKWNTTNPGSLVWKTLVFNKHINSFIEDRGPLEKQHSHYYRSAVPV